MYNVAQVIEEKCVAKKGCRLCIMYCPEANCLDLNTERMVAEVNIGRCKGCELCVVVCNAAKHQARIALAILDDHLTRAHDIRLALLRARHPSHGQQTDQADCGAAPEFCFTLDFRDS